MYINSKFSIHGASRLVSWRDHVTTLGNEMPRFCGFCCHKNRRVGNGKGKLSDNSRWQGSIWRMNTLWLCFFSFQHVYKIIYTIFARRMVTYCKWQYFPMVVHTRWDFRCFCQITSCLLLPNHPDMCDTTFFNDSSFCAWSLLFPI